MGNSNKGEIGFPCAMGSVLRGENGGLGNQFAISTYLGV
jgi:hypothetical protein